MTQITRNIDPASARDLLVRVPRACIAFTHRDRPQAQPVILRWHGVQNGPNHREARSEAQSPPDNLFYRIGLPVSASCMPHPGQEIVLLVDEGIHYFDLRAIYVRGLAQPVTPEDDLRREFVWFEVTPSKTVAWDYGTIHEVEDGA